MSRQSRYTSQRWGQFIEVLSQVDEAVNQLLVKQYVQLNLHLGVKCYISVTTGFACVDIREYYFNRTTKEVKPCKKGIALRTSEWVALKDVCSTTQQETCGARQRSIVHLPVGPQQSRRGAQLYRVSPLPQRRTVLFSNNITIYQSEHCGEKRNNADFRVE